MAIISVHRCKNYDEDNVYEAVEKLIDNIGGWTNYIKPGKKVVVKPNLLMFKKPEEAATTHPSVVKAVITQVQKAGGIVTIAESPGGPYNVSMLRRVYKSTGIEKVADETGAILNYDLRVKTINCGKSKYLKQIEVIKPVAEADIIINLPKLKTHTMMTYTGAVKNMFGVIAGTAKTDLHMRMPDYNKFADCILDIFLSVRPTINLMDAVYGMEGFGPTNGNPRYLGFLMASADGIALDAAATKVIQLPHEKVLVLDNAKKRGLLNENIQIIGEQIENIMVKDFYVPVLTDAERYDRANRGILKVLRKWLRPRPVINNDLCVGCGNCERNCPPKVITIENGKEPVIDYKNCIRCFCCHELCPHNAIVVYRSRLSRAMVNRSIAGSKEE